MFLNSKKRMFIVEIERRQIVRKRSESQLIVCSQCHSESDFISIRQATSIFCTEETQLFDFISENRSHYKTNENGEIFICLNSFIEAINKKTKRSKIKLLGESK